jgi:hypothetical protein
MKVGSTADALMEVLVSPNEHDSNLEAANVVDGLFAIARGLDRIATSIDNLGTGNASTPLGAIELLSKEVKDGFSSLSSAVETGIREGLS